MIAERRVDALGADAQHTGGLDLVLTAAPAGTATGGQHGHGQQDGQHHYSDSTTGATQQRAGGVPARVLLSIILRRRPGRPAAKDERGTSTLRQRRVAPDDARRDPAVGAWRSGSRR